VSKEINIVCLKWGTKYQSHHVNKLYAAVKRHTTVDWKFHCFTDDAAGLVDGIAVHGLPHKNLEGWWHKLYLFSNDLPIPKGERIFFIDLDTLVTRNIDALLTHDCRSIVVLRDLYTGLAKTVTGTDNVGSGLMSWYHGDYPQVWDSFKKNPAAAIAQVKPHGDQKWVQLTATDRKYWQDLFPDKVVSFKVHCNSGLPSAASVVCYHGRPTIEESYSQTSTVWKWVIPPQKWVLEHWRE
jgi:hypothetical protein